MTAADVIPDPVFWDELGGDYYDALFSPETDDQEPGQ